MSLHQRQSLPTDGLFSFHVEGWRAFQRIMPRRTAAATLELGPLSVHSRCPFAYHRLTDSTFTPPPPTFPSPEQSCPHPLTHLPTPRAQQQRLGIRQRGSRLSEHCREQREGAGSLDGTREHVGT